MATSTHFQPSLAMVSASAVTVAQTSLYRVPQLLERRRLGGCRVEETEETAAPNERGEKLKGELDDLLDEIDEVLEENAEDFVKSYVQKGGE